MSESEKVLVLRTCSADMTSYGGFRWPESGPVECRDWDSEAKCGNGLHGLLWGCGCGRLLDWSDSAKWLVVEVAEADIVELAGKVKFPRGVVVFCGDRKSVTDYLLANGAADKPVVGCFKAGGYRATVSGGDRATVSGGDGATVSGGDWATVSGGDRAVLQLLYFDGGRWRIAVAYVGENGIKPNVPYRLDKNHRFVRVDKK